MFIRYTIITPLPQHEISIHDFKIIKPISHGAFGKVFLTFKKDQPDRRYAVKIMDKTSMVAKNMVSQVNAERDALAFSDSPFVVHLYYSLQSHHNIYLVMEYCIGGDVKSLLSIYTNFDLDMSVSYVAQIILALSYLHSHGIIHRDLKPDNLLITHEGRLKLTDFGLSKIIFDRHTIIDDIGSKVVSPSQEYFRTPNQMLSLTSHLQFTVQQRRKNMRLIQQSNNPTTPISTKSNYMISRRTERTSLITSHKLSLNSPASETTTPKNTCKMMTFDSPEVFRRTATDPKKNLFLGTDNSLTTPRVLRFSENSSLTGTSPSIGAGSPCTGEGSPCNGAGSPCNRADYTPTNTVQSPLSEHFANKLRFESDDEEGFDCLSEVDQVNRDITATTPLNNKTISRVIPVQTAASSSSFRSCERYPPMRKGGGDADKEDEESLPDSLTEDIEPMISKKMKKLTIFKSLPNCNVKIEQGKVKAFQFREPDSKVKPPLAEQKTPERTSNAQILGTPDYLAPELILQKPHTLSVDWWSLGVCFFEFLTGCPPFNDDCIEEVFTNIINRNILWPDVKYMKLSPESVRVINSLLSVDPDLRPTTNELKKNTLFSHINWENISEMKPHFVPNPDDSDDTSYFNVHTDFEQFEYSDSS